MKDFAITRIILKRPVTAMMLSLMVVGFGLFSLSNQKVTLCRSYESPVMGICVNYSNVSPDEMLRLVVEPIEAVVMGGEGVESLDSNVRRGGAFLILRMRPGRDIVITEQKVREAVGGRRNRLPEEGDEPTSFQFDPESAPIMNVSAEYYVL